MTPPKLTPAQLSNFIPLTAQLYPLWRARSLSWLSGQPLSLGREARLFTRLAQPQPGQRWLDIGTSTGFYAGVLAGCGCEVDAADLGVPMLLVARQRERSPLIRWHALNAEASGLPGGYDGITIGATLGETASPARLLREAQRLLKPGGQLWLMYVPASSSLEQRLLGALGGLTFPDLSWIERQLPDLQLRHSVRFGGVELALFDKEA